MDTIVNTIDVLGDDVLFEKIVNRSITEFNDDTITAIGDYAFSGCSDLATVNVPNITSIGNSAFCECEMLSSIVIPLATSLDNYAFADCSTLEHIYGPSVVTIGGSVFIGCSLLETAIFPNVTTVGQQSFMNCSALTLVDLRSVESITAGRGFFVGCENLSTLILGNTEQVVTVSGGLSLNTTPIGSGSGYIYVPSTLIDDYKASSAFSAFESQIRALEDYTVDGTVTGELDTTRCRVRFFNEDGTLLGYVMVPNGGSAIYDGDDPVKGAGYKFTGWSPTPVNVTADMDCYAQFRFTGSIARQMVVRTITSYEDDVVEKVRDYAFYGCSALKTADFSAVTSIGNYAFQVCSALTTVILRNTAKVATLSNANAFASTPIASGTGYIYVPRSLVDSYKTATNWSTYASQFRAIEDYPDICGGGN